MQNTEIYILMLNIWPQQENLRKKTGKNKISSKLHRVFLKGMYPQLPRGFNWLGLSLDPRIWFSLLLLFDFKIVLISIYYNIISFSRHLAMLWVVIRANPQQTRKESVIILNILYVLNSPKIIKQRTCRYCQITARPSLRHFTLCWVSPGYWHSQNLLANWNVYSYRASL